MKKSKKKLDQPAPVRQVLWADRPAKSRRSVMGWRVGPGLVGDLQSARQRVMSERAVARGRLALDTGYG